MDVWHVLSPPPSTEGGLTCRVQNRNLPPNSNVAFKSDPVHPHADVTAKGESVANLADIGGTITGILLSRTKLGMVPTFCLLSAGYLYASRQEVATMKLPYLNRARLAFAARTFLATGVVPDPTLANAKEPLVPWGPYGQVQFPDSQLLVRTSRHV